jgi:glutamyl-tRNA synthetase
MNYSELAELLFPNVTLTREDILKKYPRRSENLVVTRLAPSPTGFLHIGGVYTALINKKIATQANGVFMLRIEDTDKKREVAGSRRIITNVFNKLGIGIDEGVINETEEIGNYGPYVQSNRVEIYHALAKYLVLKGYAYPCFSTEEELNELREKQNEEKIMTGYYGKFAIWRDRDISEIKEKLSKNTPYVLRFRVPEDSEKRIELDDLIKGHLEMENNFNDFVLLKTDGIPTYHFAHACDDFLMGTTHVIRGDEWIASLPIHLQLFKALEFKLPHYAHVAPVMKNDNGSRRKLSKRKDPESNAEFYLEMGYPAKALYVYLYTLINSNFEEWYDNNHQTDLNEFEIKFENMGVSGPLYDLDKLNNISAQIIYETSVDENVENLLKWAKEFNPSQYELFNNHKELVKKIFMTQGYSSVEHRKDLKHYSDFMNQFGFFFDEVFKNDSDIKDLMYQNVTKEDLPLIIDSLISYFNERRNGSEKMLKDLSKELNYTDKKHFQKEPDKYRGLVMNFYHIMNLALTHKENGMSTDDIIRVLGYDEVTKRFSVIKEWI